VSTRMSTLVLDYSDSTAFLLRFRRVLLRIKTV